MQARIDAQAESFDRSYSVPEAMDAPLLESALPVSVGGQAAALMCGGGWEGDRGSMPWGWGAKKGWMQPWSPSQRYSDRHFVTMYVVRTTVQPRVTALVQLHHVA